MDRNTLEDYFRLRQDIRNGENKIEELRQKAVSAGGGANDGMPRNPNVGDRIGSMTAVILDAEREIAELKSFADDTGARVEEWILTISDVYARIILRKRYHEAMSWEGIAEAMGEHGAGNRLCKLAMRYVPKI